jgi:predicted alpha/beta-hydrolase family hydrolase
MAMNDVEYISTGEKRISGVWTRPASAPAAAILLAHGAGAKRDHPSMESLAQALAAERFLVFRFNFPYSESGRKYPDHPKVLTGTWLDVWAWTWTQPDLDNLNVFAGGRSMGGRMASMAAVQNPESFSPAGLVVHFRDP